MFTDLLIEEWGVGIKQYIDEQLGDDCVNENQFGEDDQESNDEIADDCPHGFYFSSPEPIVDMPLNDSSMQENDYDQISTIQDYDLDIDIEGELIKSWSSLAKEGTNQEGEQNNHYQESSIVDTLICDSIEDPHGLVDNYFDPDHILEEDRSHDNHDMIVSKHPCHNKIPHALLNQDVLV